MTRRPKRFLLLSYAAVALTIVGMRTFFLTADYQATMDRAAAATRDMATIADEHIRRVFDTGDLAAEAVLWEIRSRGGLDAMAKEASGQKALADVARKLAPGSAIWLIGGDGRPVLMSDLSMAVPADLSDKDWWHALAERGEDRYVGEALVGGRVYGGIFFTYSRRITDADGRFHGVVLLVLRPPSVSSLRFPGKMGETSAIAVYRLDRHLVTRVPISESMVERTQTNDLLFGALEHNPTGTFRAVSENDGVERLISYRHLQDWPLVVSAGAAVDDILAPWYASLLSSIIVLATILSGLTLLTWLGVRSMHREMRSRVEIERMNRSLAVALADQDVLFKEVHHRVKNNLQTVGALLTMQMRRFEDPAVCAAFQETASRIQSMGLVHESLYTTGEAAEVRLSDYLRRLVDGLALSHGTAERGIRTRLELADCTVHLDQAIPIALTVTEVVINALKHAFPSGTGGELAISMHCDPTGVRIQVRDSGPGLPDTLRNGSLGMTLIGALCQQIGARHHFTTDNGTHFSLEVPTRAPATA